MASRAGTRRTTAGTATATDVVTASRAETVWPTRTVNKPCVRARLHGVHVRARTSLLGGTACMSKLRLHVRVCVSARARRHTVCVCAPSISMYTQIDSNYRQFGAASI